MPKKYKIEINITKTVEAEDEIDAKNKFFQEIESEPQQTLDSFLDKHIRIINMTDTSHHSKDCTGIHLSNLYSCKDEKEWQKNKSKTAFPESNKEKFMRVIVEEFLNHCLSFLSKDLKEKTTEHIGLWYDYITKQEKERIEKKITEIIK